MWRRLGRQAPQLETEDNVGTVGAGLVHFRGEYVIAIDEVGNANGEEPFVNGIAHGAANTVGLPIQRSRRQPQPEDFHSIEIDRGCIVQDHSESKQVLSSDLILEKVLSKIIGANPGTGVVGKA